jgi:hypothetical protein
VHSATAAEPKALVRKETWVDSSEEISWRLA